MADTSKCKQCIGKFAKPAHTTTTTHIIPPRRPWRGYRESTHPDPPAHHLPSHVSERQGESDSGEREREDPRISGIDAVSYKNVPCGEGRCTYAYFVCKTPLSVIYTHVYGIDARGMPVKRCTCRAQYGMSVLRVSGISRAAFTKNTFAEHRLLDLVYPPLLDSKSLSHRYPWVACCPDELSSWETTSRHLTRERARWWPCSNYRPRKEDIQTFQAWGAQSSGLIQ